MSRTDDRCVLRSLYGNDVPARLHVALFANIHYTVWLHNTSRLKCAAQIQKANNHGETKVSRTVHRDGGDAWGKWGVPVKPKHGLEK